MKKYFQVNPEIIYLNSGSHSLVPLKVLAALKNYQIEFEKNPTQGLFFAWQNLWEVQKPLAQFFGSDPTSFFLRNNITEPMNEFILGMPLSAGSEILTTDQEYGAVYNICRFRCEKDGLKLREIKLPNKDEVKTAKQDDYVDRIISAIQPQTKMLVLSEVFTGHGLVLPIKEIAKETRKKNVLLVVDGAHSPGFIPLNFSELNDVDFYGGNLHKWFMGPKGTGFGWVNELHKNKLRPLQAGWTTFESFEPFNSFGAGDRFAVQMLMLGSHDFSPFYALKETLEFWREIGANKIYQHIRDLGKYLTQIADEALQLSRFSSADERLIGPLHAYRLPDRLQKQSYWGVMEDILQKTSVQVSVTTVQQELYLRLSPHIYNTEDELLESVKRLSRYLGSI